jgi:glycosyltransferase involved in cell wall biosynthesis
MAAYGRPEVLVFAVQSVLAQTFRDWELVVVADACQRSETAMAEFNDPRIRVFQLARNFGDQSGPNNFGVAQARGRLIAFLNQDDLWFPDHLQLCIEALETSGADLVFAYSAAVAQSDAQALHAGAWVAGLTGIPRQGNYDPVTTFAPASSWLMRRDLSEIVGGWHSAEECPVEPSRDFLYRAWRQKSRLRSCPELTVLSFSSGGRKNSYAGDLSFEQRGWLNTAGLSATTRARLWNRLNYTAPADFRRLISNAIESLKHLLLSGVAHLGINPLAPLYLWRYGFRKGAFIDRLKAIRGLASTKDRKCAAQRAQAQAVEAACRYMLGEDIHFAQNGNAAAYQLAGWSYPEPWGCWTEGKHASLLFHWVEMPDEDVVLLIEAQALATEGGHKQRLRIRANGTTVAEQEWINPGFRTVEIDIPRVLITQAETMHLELILPDSISPAPIDGLKDRRRLGLGLKTMSLYRKPVGVVD